MKATALLHLTFLLGTTPEAHAEEIAFDEYQVKAAFLFNLAKFVEWPPAAFEDSTDPITICVAGQSSFGSTLEEMIPGKRVGTRGFAIRRLLDTQRTGVCKILFLSASEWKRTRTLPAALKSTSILTVGETDDFIAGGGIVNLRLEGSRIRIQVSLDAAEGTGLRISSKLLALAEIVKKKP
jgi:hypothetical protein